MVMRLPPGLYEALVAVVISVLVYATFAEIFGTIARRRPEETGRIALRFLKPFDGAEDLGERRIDED